MQFAIVSDTHFVPVGTVADGVWWHKTIYSTEKRHESIVRSIKKQDPDFVIHCGDVTADNRTASLELGIRLMENIGVPWHMTVGNHDVNRPGLREPIAKMTGSPQEMNEYAVSYDSGEHTLTFLFLDLCRYRWRDGIVRPYLEETAYKEGDILRFGMDDTQFAWLEHALEKHHKDSCFLVTHTPILYKDEVWIGTLPKAEHTFEKKARLDRLNPRLDDESTDRLIGWIDRYAHSIKAVFSGHTHINEVINRKGVFYCTTASLREWPFEFRMATKERNRLMVTTHAIDDESLQETSYEAWRKNDWVKGDTSDRNFAIEL